METSDAVQKSEHLRRENERMKILTADLASQVGEYYPINSLILQFVSTQSNLYL